MDRVDVGGREMTFGDTQTVRLMAKHGGETTVRLLLNDALNELDVLRSVLQVAREECALKDREILSLLEIVRQLQDQGGDED